MMVQYYGEHVTGDGRLDSLPAMADLVTALSPHFTRAYLFSAFALIDAGRPDVGYAILERGFKENPGDWRFPAYLGFFAYRYGAGADKDLVAAQWYQQAARDPGQPAVHPAAGGDAPDQGRRRSRRPSSCGDRRTWPATSTRGSELSRSSARYCPQDKAARMKAVAPLYDTMPKAQADALVAELFKGYSP